MKFQLTILTLLAAGAYVSASDGVKGELAYGRKYFQRKFGFQCPPRNRWTTTTSPPTSTPTEEPNDQCAECPNLKMNVYDTYVNYTFPNPGFNTPCQCAYNEIICGDGEIINRETCIDGGSSLADCGCIPATTTTTTTTTTYPEPFFG